MAKKTVPDEENRKPNISGRVRGLLNGDGSGIGDFSGILMGTGIVLTGPARPGPITEIYYICLYILYCYINNTIKLSKPYHSLSTIRAQAADFLVPSHSQISNSQISNSQSLILSTLTLTHVSHSRCIFSLTAAADDRPTTSVADDLLRCCRPPPPSPLPSYHLRRIRPAACCRRPTIYCRSALYSRYKAFTFCVFIYTLPNM